MINKLMALANMVGTRNKESFQKMNLTEILYDKRWSVLHVNLVNV